MNTTHDDNATTWRDLADALTPEQIRRFERFEALSMKSIQQKPQPRGWVPDSAEDSSEYRRDLLGPCLLASPTPVQPG
jgi:hypothetical protein